MSISNQVRIYRNELEQELGFVERGISHCEETIRRLTTENQPFPVANLVKKNREKLADLETQAKDLARKIEDVDNGSYDVKLKQVLAANREEAARKAALTKQKKSGSNNMIQGKSSGAPKTQKQKREEKKQQAIQFNQRKRFTSERDLARSEEYFMRTCNSVPDHLRRNLKEMPNNCGYIWNGVWCMGEKPARRPLNVCTMHEKKGGRFYVHVYDETGHKLFEKDSRGNKTLVKEERRERKINKT